MFYINEHLSVIPAVECTKNLRAKENINSFHLNFPVNLSMMPSLNFEDFFLNLFVLLFIFYSFIIFNLFALKFQNIFVYTVFKRKNKKLLKEKQFVVTKE